MSEEVKDQTATAGVQKVKRGRGRPLGSRNKPKSSSVSATPVTADAASATVNK